MCIRDSYKDISPFAIATLADFYGVSTDYLMGLTENKNHPNTELQSLHLSDDMVEMCIRDRTRANTVMGFAISLIIAFVGILNFVNSMVTAIVSRQDVYKRQILDGHPPNADSI